MQVKTHVKAGAGGWSGSHPGPIGPGAEREPSVPRLAPRRLITASATCGHAA